MFLTNSQEFFLKSRCQSIVKFFHCKYLLLVCSWFLTSLSLLLKCFHFIVVFYQLSLYHFCVFQENLSYSNAIEIFISMLCTEILVFSLVLIIFYLHSWILQINHHFQCLYFFYLVILVTCSKKMKNGSGVKNIVMFMFLILKGILPVLSH